MPSPNCPMCQKSLQLFDLKTRKSYFRCFDHGVWVHISFFRWFKGAAHIGDELLAARNRPVAHPDKTLSCPQCQTPMLVTTAKLGTSLQVDQCLRCNNVWFDVGEMEQLQGKGELEEEFPTEPLRSETLGSSALAHHEVKMKWLSNDPSAVEVPVNPLMFLGLPVEDDSESGPNTPIATALFGLWMIAMSAWGFKDPHYLAAHAYYASTPLINHGVNLFSSIVMHAGWPHLLSNRYFYFLAGHNIEEKEGPFFFLALFWGAGVAGNLFTTYMHLAIPSVGASGAISGLLTYYALMFPDHRLQFGFFNRARFFTFSLRASTYVFLWGSMQLLSVLFQSSHDQTNYYAHAGGLLAGIAFYVFRNLSEVSDRNRSRSDWLLCGEPHGLRHCSFSNPLTY